MNYRCEFEFGLLFEISGGLSRKKLSRSAFSALETDTMLQHLEARDLAPGTAALSCGCSCG